MIKTDYHMHTSFSSDSSTDMEDMIRKAIALGFKEIAITDHVDFTPQGVLYQEHVDYEAYLPVFNRLKEEYANSINIVFGVEIGLAPHVLKQVEEVALKWPFEFIIGSTHDVEKLDLYTHRKEFYGGRSKKEVYDIYFNEVLFNVKNFQSFCVYGHMDYVNRYAPYDDSNVYYEEFRWIIDEILKELIARGKGLELNMSGYRYGLNQGHPQLDILKRYREMGGEIITVGSDAHSTEYVGSHFDDAYELLKTAGFKAYTLFRNRKPIWIDLD